MINLIVNSEELESLIGDSVCKALREYLPEMVPFQPKVEQPPEYISKRRAAKIAGVSVSTIDNWRRAGKIEKYVLGGSVRFKHLDFIAFLESSRLN